MAETKEVIIGDYKYLVVDERPKLNEPYINMFVVDRERSVQTHTEKRHIINHKKDYRWRFCYRIISSTDPKLSNH